MKFLIQIHRSKCYDCRSSKKVIAATPTSTFFCCPSMLAKGFGPQKDVQSYVERKFLLDFFLERTMGCSTWNKSIGKMSMLVLCLGNWFTHGLCIEKTARRRIFKRKPLKRYLCDLVSGFAIITKRKSRQRKLSCWRRYRTLALWSIVFLVN